LIKINSIIDKGIGFLNPKSITIKMAKALNTAQYFVVCCVFELFKQFSKR